MRLKERQGALVHSTALAGAHLQEVKNAILSSLEGAMEVLGRVDVAAVLPLHLHKRADSETVGLAKVGTAAQNIEELVLLAKLGKTIAQLGIYLLTCRGKNLIHLGDTGIHIGKIGVALLLIEQLGRKRQRNASGDLSLRHALAPWVDPRGPLAGVDLRSSVVGLGDHRSAGGKGNLAALNDLGGVATVAASNDQGLLAQTTRTHDIELASRIDIRSEGGCLALQKLVSRDQIDHGATTSNPVDAVELALLGNCLFDQIVCVHIQFLSCLGRNQ